MRSQWDKCENYEFDVYKKFDAEKKLQESQKKNAMKMIKKKVELMKSKKSLFQSEFILHMIVGGSFFNLLEKCHEPGR